MWLLVWQDLFFVTTGSVELWFRLDSFTHRRHGCAEHRRPTVEVYVQQNDWVEEDRYVQYSAGPFAKLYILAFLFLFLEPARSINANNLYIDCTAYSSSRVIFSCIHVVLLCDNIRKDHFEWKYLCLHS